MTNPTIEATLNYQENCDYKQSSTTCDITLSKQDVIITANISVRDYNQRIVNTSTDDYYYNDVLRLFITITDANNNGVPNGFVNVYYAENATTILNTENLITKTPIPVDEQGNVSVLYQPHHSGYFIVQYHNSQTYNDKTEYYPVLLKKIPTLLNFYENIPRFVHLEDTVSLKVSVQDVYGQPLNYGIVTFLSYQIADATDEDTELSLSGQEKVIGNPVMVIDGVAETTYSPIQLLEEDILPKGTEFIRAVFNYGERNDKYGSAYKYYAPDSCWTNIPLLYPSNLTIDVVTIKNNQLQKVTMSDGDIIMSDGFIHIKSNQHLHLRFAFTNSRNERIALDNNLKVYFNVKGTEDKLIIDNITADTETYVNQYHQYIDYDKGYEASYYPEIYGEENIFLSDIGNIPTGYYTIQAYINKGGHTISKGQLKDIDGHDVDIEDIYYYEAAESEKLYLAVDFGTQDYTINIDTETINEIYGINTIAKDIHNPITATIDIEKQYYPYLNNQPCVFVIPKINKEYKGIIKIQNNQLKAILQDTIIFTYADDYPIYVYVKGKSYTYNNNQITFSDVYSNPNDNHNMPIYMSARFNLVPQINIRYNSQIYSGDVDIDISVDNIFDENLNLDTIIVSKNNYTYTELTDSCSLNKNHHTHTIHMSDLSAGEYLVQTRIQNHNYISETFTISKATLTAYNDVLNNVPTGNIQTIKIYLNTNSNKLTDLNINKLHVAVKYDNIVNTYNIDNNNISINNTKDIITFNMPLYNEGEYQIKVLYDGDENFEILNPTTYPIVFNTKTVYGSLQINRYVIKPSPSGNNEGITDNDEFEDYIDLFINYNGINNQYIIGEIQATDYSNNKLFIPFISDKQGHIHLYNPINSYTWQSYNNFIINIDPTNTYIINALLNFDTPQEAIENYFYNNNTKYRYNNTNIPIQFGAEDNNNIYFAQIKQQLIASGNKTLFTTYKKQTLMETKDES